MRHALLALLLVAAAACTVKGDQTTDPVASTCAAVNAACADNAACCSFACYAGVCIANIQPGGLCRTSDDCTFTMTCVSGHCQPGYTCAPTFGDVCSSNNDCCSGNCVGESTSVYPPRPGTCGTETAPTVELGGPFTVPYYATTTLRATVTDPDVEDVMYYAWDVVSAPTAAALGGWTSTAAAPSVFLSAKGTYVFRVRVVDGPSSQRNRLTSQDTVTITAVNLAPVVAADPLHLATTALRNTAVTLTGSVSDPNGTAAPVSCEWYAKPPGQAEITTPVAQWSSCPASPSTTFVPPITGPEGAWQFRLHAKDDELETSDVRVVQVVNAAPVAVACAYECAAPPPGGSPSLRAGNLGPPGQAAPPVPLQGSATDANGDVGTSGFTWEWRLETPAPGSALSAGALLGQGTGASPPPFAGELDPDVAGTYVVRLHVDDGWGASADATVPVIVDPWLRPLHALDAGTGLPLGSVVDAAYDHAATASNDRVVYVGADSSTVTSRLWVLDPESAASAAVPFATLGAAPLCLGLSPDGASALVGADQSGSSRWIRVTLGATPSAGAPNLFGAGWSGTPADVLDTGSREFAVSTTGAVHQLGTSAGSSSTPATCASGSACTPAAVVGSHGVSATDLLWLLDASGTVRRFPVRPNGDLDSPTVASGFTGATDLWLSALHGASREVAVSTGVVRDATSLLAAATLPFAARHLDTASVSSVLEGVAVSADGRRVELLDAGYGAAGTLALPRVGYRGTGYPLEAMFAFVRSDGTARYVVLRASVAGAWRFYLARY